MKFALVLSVFVVVLAFARADGPVEQAKSQASASLSQLEALEKESTANAIALFKEKKLDQEFYNKVQEDIEKIADAADQFEKTLADEATKQGVKDAVQEIFDEIGKAVQQTTIKTGLVFKVLSKKQASQ